MNWRPPLRGCHAPTRPRHSGWPDASFPAWPPWTPRPGSAVTEGATADLEDNLPSRDCPGWPRTRAGATLRGRRKSCTGCRSGAPHARGRDLAGLARAGPCWPILPREVDDVVHPEAAGAAARRGAVAEAGAAPDADPATPGSAVAPRGGPEGACDA